MSTLANVLIMEKTPDEYLGALIATYRSAGYSCRAVFISYIYAGSRGRYVAAILRLIRQISQSVE